MVRPARGQSLIHIFDMYQHISGAQHWLRDTPRCSCRGNRVCETGSAQLFQRIYLGARGITDIDTTTVIGRYTGGDLFLMTSKLLTIVFVLGIGLILSAPQRVNAVTVTWEDALGQFDESVLTNLDLSALPSLTDLDEAQLQAVCRELQKRFQGEYVLELAPLRDVASAALPLLDQHAAKLMSIKQLSGRFLLSEKHFRRLFKLHTGLSPYQYYLQSRIHRAKEMLLGTTMSIKEIAASLHFENAFHFSKAFKGKAGMSPSQWRGGTSKSA